MNERIKELALKSGIAYLSEHTAYLQANDGLTVLPSVSSLEEFAELIVEDACRAMNPMLRDMISRGQAVDLIKQHFGIEE